MKKKIGTMDIILTLIGAFIFLFTITMIVVFVIKDGIPDTLVTCVFSIFGGECGIMGLIKTVKLKLGKDDNVD